MQRIWVQGYDFLLVGAVIQRLKDKGRLSEFISYVEWSRSPR